MKYLYSILITFILFNTTDGQVSVNSAGQLSIINPSGLSNFLNFGQNSQFYSMDMFQGGLVFRPNNDPNLYSVIMTDDTDYPVSFWGKINLGTQASGIVLEAAGAQALWYDANFFSWGYGKDWNYFADEILIGGETGPAFTPSNSDGLSIAGSKDIRLDGSGNRALRFTNGSSVPVAAIDLAVTSLSVRNNIPTGNNHYIVQDGNHVFKTNNSQYRMTITSGGFVGIGTSTPSEKLHVESDLTADIRLEADRGKYLRYFKDNIEQAHIGVSSNFDLVVNNKEPGGNIYFHTEDTERMVIDSTGNVGIGTSTPAYKLQVSGNADITGELTAASDIRLKKNIKPLQNALNTIRDLNPVTYNFRVDEYPSLALSTRSRMGLIAQEVLEVLPAHVSDGGVTTNRDGISIQVKSVNYMDLIPLLIKSVQELELELKDTQRKLDEKSEQLAKVICCKSKNCVK